MIQISSFLVFYDTFQFISKSQILNCALITSYESTSSICSFFYYSILSFLPLSFPFLPPFLPPSFLIPLIPFLFLILFHYLPLFFLTLILFLILPYVLSLPLCNSLSPSFSLFLSLTYTLSLSLSLSNSPSLSLTLPHSLFMFFRFLGSRVSCNR